MSMDFFYIILIIIKMSHVQIDCRRLNSWYHNQELYIPFVRCAMHNFLHLYDVYKESQEFGIVLFMNYFYRCSFNIHKQRIVWCECLNSDEADATHAHTEQMVQKGTKIIIITIAMTCQCAIAWIHRQTAYTVRSHSVLCQPWNLDEFVQFPTKRNENTPKWKY